jgi:hypothetical protein
VIRVAAPALGGPAWRGRDVRRSGARLAGVLIAVAACAGQDVSPPLPPARPVVVDAASAEPQVSVAPSEPPELDPANAIDPDPGVAASTPAAMPAAIPAVAAPATGPEVWLKGVTHVHAHASGDSSEPNASVIAWYAQRHYDFIVLTDHNRVSELDPGNDTHGQVALRDPRAGLMVLSGIELTHNPVGCQPAGDPHGNCRIHVNLLGPTARPSGRLEWAERHSHARIDMYAAALRAQGWLGGLAQINHPQWLWGMTPELLVELAHRGVRLVEIANSAFARWNAGDAAHPSTEALWDAALMRGAQLFGTASDDAHDYGGHGKYPPGGGWVVVRARRDPVAILEALAAGRFYASNGVVLERAEVVDGSLVIAVDPAAGGSYTIDFIENGRRVASERGKVARRSVPARGYVRALVTRDDGTRAWVQPVRR